MTDPVGISVYNFGRSNHAEATVAGTDPFTKMEMADQLLERLLQTHYISRYTSPMNKLTIKACVIGLLEDKDGDNYLEIPIDKLVADMKQMGIKLEKPASQLERTISGMDIFDTYFPTPRKATVSGRYNFKGPIKDMKTYIRAKYSPRSKWWKNPTKFRQFQQDMKDFMAQYFTTPKILTSLAKAEDVVNDKFTKGLATDKTLEKYAKDGNGRAIGDCGTFKQTYATLLKSAGLKVLHGHLVLRRKKSYAIAGHGVIVALAPGGKQAFLTNNLSISAVGDGSRRLSPAQLKEATKACAPKGYVHVDTILEKNEATIADAIYPIGLFNNTVNTLVELFSQVSRLDSLKTGSNEYVRTLAQYSIRYGPIKARALMQRDLQKLKTKTLQSVQDTLTNLRLFQAAVKKKGLKSLKFQTKIDIGQRQITLSMNPKDTPKFVRHLRTVLLVYQQKMNPTSLTAKERAIAGSQQAINSAQQYFKQTTRNELLEKSTRLFAQFIDLKLLPKLIT